MLISMDVVLYVVCGLLVYILLSFRPRNNKFPPGPWSVPILGHLPLLGKNPHKKLIEWKKTYGPVIGLKFGSYRTVFLHGPEVIREAFNSPAFTGRPKLLPFLDRSGGVARGILFTEGDEWVEQRRFTLRNLRDFGFGKQSLEAIIQHEVLELIANLQQDLSSGDSTISTNNKFNAAVLNVIWTIMMGERFELNDPELQVAIHGLTSDIQENNTASGLAMFLPAFARMAPNLSGYSKILRNLDTVMNFLRKQFEKHNKSFVEGQKRDFLDAYLEEIKNCSNPDSSFYQETGYHSSLFVIVDLFVAGAETTSTTLTWLFLYMALYPEVQEKLHKELDQVLGSSRLPCLADRANLPYTEAVIHETLRFSTLVPFSLFHNTIKDVEFQGFVIPKDTMVVPNVYDTHFDPEIWGDPDNFRPERFINEDGKFQKNDAMIAFSVGKRACLGESLARDELFLFTTHLFQKFSVSPNPNGPKLTTQPIQFNQILSPVPHKLVLKTRN